MASKRSKTADPPNSDIEEAKPLRIVAIDSVVAALPGLTFNLSSLGWKAFQDLCGSVLRQVLQQVIVPFPEGPDAGRDLAFEGHGWSQNPTDARRSFVVQCKFRQTPGTLGLSVVKPELPKIRRLHAQGRCDTYVLMTNGRVTADSEQEIRRLVLEAGPSECVVLGGDYIDAAIRENPPLRALVPRVYGLGDLSQILDQRAYAQAAALLAASHEALSKFVVTQPYQKAIEALNRHGFVLLLGPPAAGKSMIASSLAMSALDQWRCPTVKADSPDLFISHWNPHEPGQFFWIDDAFGTTQYQLRLADQWNRVLPQLRAAIERRTRVVMTSRDYIWKAAREDLKLSDFEPLESSQVIVDVRALSLDDRRQILYNHVRYGDQSQSFRRRVKPLLEGACRVEPFLPEVARRFGDQRFTQHLALDSWSVRFFFSHPVEHLRDVVRSLTSDGRAALALIFVSGGYLKAPLERTSDQIETVALFGSSIAGAARALNELRDSVVSLVPAPGKIRQNVSETAAEPPQSVWTYRHPTIGEAFRQLIADDPELLRIYLAGTPLSSLMFEISCGTLGIKGAMVVPDSDFPVILRRLREAPSEKLSREAVASFLAGRCSPKFLRFVLSEAPSLIEGYGAGMPVRLAVRLHELGLMKEDLRLDLVSQWAELLIVKLDPRALTAPGSSLLTLREFRTLLAKAEEEVVPRIPDRLYSLESHYDGSESPDSYLEQTKELTSALRQELEEAGREESLDTLDDLVGDIDRLEEELASRYGQIEADDTDWLEDDRYSPASVGDASIFSDIDQ